MIMVGEMEGEGVVLRPEAEQNTMQYADGKGEGRGIYYIG